MTNPGDVHDEEYNEAHTTLHNIAAKAGVAFLEPEDIEDDDEEEDRCEDGLPHNYAAGFHARRRVIETFF